MNNYSVYQDNYRNFFPKAQDHYIENNKNNDLYDPYQGFIRGNMYKNLYDPYKIKQPYEIRPMNNQAEILTYIDALCFACIDLDLYLDIYPEDQEKVALYNKYLMEKKKVTEEYESKFGPLTLDGNGLKNYPWAWDDKPWPWEGN